MNHLLRRNHKNTWIQIPHPLINSHNSYLEMLENEIESAVNAEFEEWYKNHVRNRAKIRALTNRNQGL